MDAPLSTPMWEAARATSAAPFFFPPFKFSDMTLYDGGLLRNNPARVALDEARSIWGDSVTIDAFVSLGTGTTPTFYSGSEPPHLKQAMTLAKTMLNQCTNTTEADRDVRQRWAAESEVYFRFSPSDLGNLPLNAASHHAVEQMRTATQSLLSHEQRSIERCCEVLLARDSIVLHPEAIPLTTWSSPSRSVGIECLVMPKSALRKDVSAMQIAGRLAHESRSMSSLTHTEPITGAALIQVSSSLQQVGEYRCMVDCCSAARPIQIAEIAFRIDATPPLKATVTSPPHLTLGKSSEVIVEIKDAIIRKLVRLP